MYKGVGYQEFNFLETIYVYCNTKEYLFEFYVKHIVLPLMGSSTIS